MQDYKIFWTPTMAFSFMGCFTTETIGRTTLFYDMNGEERMTVRHQRRPKEAFVDELLSNFTMVNPSEVYNFARDMGARGGLGRIDMTMTDDIAAKVGRAYEDRLQLMKWEDYLKRRH